MAIRAVHTLIYSDDPPATRAFLRDVLGFPYVRDASSSGTSPDDGTKGDESDWLIFGTGPSELGVHPTYAEWEGKVYESPRHHEIALVCDDIEATVAELQSRGASFEGDVTDEGFGLAIPLKVPGADDMLVYEPRHETAYDLGGSRTG